MPELTERQKEAWPDVVAEIERYTGEDTVPPLSSKKWFIRWHRELDPGRGHLISAVLIIDYWCAQVDMDVYGCPYVSVSMLDPVHCTNDEDCPCVYCTAERSEDYLDWSLGEW